MGGRIHSAVRSMYLHHCLGFTEYPRPICTSPVPIWTSQPLLQESQSPQASREISPQRNISVSWWVGLDFRQLTIVGEARPVLQLLFYGALHKWRDILGKSVCNTSSRQPSRDPHLIIDMRISGQHAYPA